MLFKILLYLHITLGSISLLIGTFIIIRKKGDKIHKRTGKLFFYSMLFSALIALILSIIHPNYFLFIIAVFSIYMVSTGQRYLSLKLLLHNQKPKLIDIFLTSMMLLFSITFILLGLSILFGLFNLNSQNLFGIVLIVFGSIALLFVKKDYVNYTGKSDTKNYWLIAHLQRMLGTYIASFTAFLVTAVNFLPGYIVWLLPTVIITPFIIKWTKKYKLNLTHS